MAFNKRRAVMAGYVAEPVSTTSLRVLTAIRKDYGPAAPNWITED
jgi:hypothetical protein